MFEIDLGPSSPRITTGKDEHAVVDVSREILGVCVSLSLPLSAEKCLYGSLTHGDFALVEN